jgi:hypothetical protein
VLVRQSQAARKEGKRREDFVSTESDVVIDVVFDMDVFLCEDEVVDVFDLGGGCRGCHVTGARSVPG